jgi:flagellar hook assembly protein FlgD
MSFHLGQNYPNSFNPETWIPYGLGEDADVSIKIHSASGQLVRTLSLGHKPAGYYSNKSEAAHWDGTNDNREPVASGVYFYTIQAGDYAATRKMLMMK